MGQGCPGWRGVRGAGTSVSTWPLTLTTTRGLTNATSISPPQVTKAAKAFKPAAQIRCLNFSTKNDSVYDSAGFFIKHLYYCIITLSVSNESTKVQTFAFHSQTRIWSNTSWQMDKTSFLRQMKVRWLTCKFDLWTRDLIIFQCTSIKWNSFSSFTWNICGFAWVSFYFPCPCVCVCVCVCVRSSIFGDKTEVILLQKLNEPLPLESVRRDPPKTAFTSNTGVCVCVCVCVCVWTVNQVLPSTQGPYLSNHEYKIGLGKKVLLLVDELVQWRHIIRVI